VKLANSGLGHPQNFTDLSEAALLLIVKTDDHLQPLREIVDGLRDDVHQLFARCLSFRRRLTRARLRKIRELEPSESGVVDLTEQTLILGQLDPELCRDLFLLGGPPEATHEIADCFGDPA
jgi:hypothetical protein